MSKLTLVDILEIPMLIVSEGLGRAVDDEFDQVVAEEFPQLMLRWRNDTTFLDCRFDVR